jgi:hypothetical protein
MSPRSFITAALVAVSLCTVGCEEENEAPIIADPQMTGSLVRVDGCKSSFTKESMQSDRSCMLFTYDATKQQLKLTHVNAAFNCCPEKIAANVSVKDGVIHIVESETGPNCRCNCLFDLYMVVENVPAASFVIKVDEPLLGEGEARMEFTVDFSKVTQGENCLPRNFYPWGM